MANKPFAPEPALPSLLERARFVNLLVGVGALAIFTVLGGGIWGGGIWTALAAGYLLGSLNQYMTIRVARRGVSMEPTRAMALVSTQYCLRFAFTLSIFAMLILKAHLSPWALLAGFVTAFLASTATAILIARGQPHNHPV